MHNLMPDQVAARLYAHARARGRRGLIWSTVTGRGRCLLSLKEIYATRTVRIHRDAGTRTVPIHQIYGSEVRCGDFDCEFNPLHDHEKERWLGIARARRRGKVLPPVELVQVGEVYFVHDGHHRISVARAMGQQQIEARVIVWQVGKAHTRAVAHPVIGRETKIGRLYKKAQEDSARLRERLLLCLRDLLMVAEVWFKALVLNQDRG